MYPPVRIKPYNGIIVSHKGHKLKKMDTFYDGTLSTVEQTMLEKVSHIIMISYYNEDVAIIL